MTEFNVTNKTIQRIASGNTRALDKLCKELKPAFVAFFREHFNMDADSVQDLYQETIPYYWAGYVLID